MPRLLDLIVLATCATSCTTEPREMSNPGNIPIASARPLQCAHVQTTCACWVTGADGSDACLPGHALDFGVMSGNEIRIVGDLIGVIGTIHCPVQTSQIDGRDQVTLSCSQPHDIACGCNDQP